MRTSIALWSADVRSVDAVSQELATVADSFHIDMVAHAHAQTPILGPSLIEALRARTTAPIEVHLLVPDPSKWIDRCIAAGASTIVISRTGEDARPLLRQVRAAGLKTALSLDIDVPVEAAMEHFDLIDGVIVMGSARNRRGADLHPAVPGRIRTLIDARRLNSETPDEPTVFVEGAVREHTLETLAAAGSDGVVVGALVLQAANPLTVIHHIGAMTATEQTQHPSSPR